ncbi:MAG: S1 RNA-binding domain-containing protein, partial [Patescibacteria group bacterium]
MLNSSKKTESVVARLVKSLPELGAVIKEGELITGKLLRRMPRAVYFDLGKFGTGVVYGVELMNAREAIKNLKEGDEASVKVVEVENDDGYVELSLAGAGRQKAWQVLKDLFEKGEEFSAKITGANSGGLLAEMEGVKAFLPVSQLSNEHYPRVEDGNKSKITEELKKLVGQDLRVKILDLNLRTDKLILSEKEITNQNVKEKLNKYKAGDIIEGMISGVADFGAFIKFVDEPEIEGLIHISEIDH